MLLHNQNCQHFFTKFLQIVCLINTQVVIYHYARCDYKLWKVPWLCCVFRKFSHRIKGWTFFVIKYCIFTKLSQTMRLINTHNWICQYATFHCRLLKVVWLNYLFENFQVLFPCYYTIRTVSQVIFWILLYILLKKQTQF